MVFLKKLEIETTELFKQKKYSTVVFEITSQSKEDDRSAIMEFVGFKQDYQQ